MATNCAPPMQPSILDDLSRMAKLTVNQSDDATSDGDDDATSDGDTDDESVSGAGESDTGEDKASDEAIKQVRVQFNLVLFFFCLGSDCQHYNVV